MKSASRLGTVRNYSVASTKFIFVIFCAAVLSVNLTACSSTGQSNKSIANSEGAQQVATAEQELSDTEKEVARTSLLKMADETLIELNALDPKLKEKIESAYAYAVFDNFMVNIVLYVAGKGNGVVIKTATKEPIYMLMLRAGTGPGLGYTRMRQLLIIQDQETFDYITTVGLDVQVSAHVALKLGSFGGSALYSDSFNPFIDVYTIVDSGIDLQANWGAVEYIKDWSLNKASKQAD